MNPANGCAVVIGAGPGLGAAVARRARQEGLAVVVSSRSAERLQPLAAELGAKAIPATPPGKRMWRACSRRSPPSMAPRSLSSTTPAPSWRSRSWT